jgi:hypothetical protein
VLGGEAGLTERRPYESGDPIDSSLSSDLSRQTPSDSPAYIRAAYVCPFAYLRVLGAGLSAGGAKGGAHQAARLRHATTLLRCT